MADDGPRTRPDLRNAGEEEAATPIGVDGERKPRQMHPIPEDEGLVKDTQRDARRAADVDGTKLTEAAQAAQRGRAV